MFYRWCGVCVVSLFAVGNLTAQTWSGEINYKSEPVSFPTRNIKVVGTSFVLTGDSPVRPRFTITVTCTDINSGEGFLGQWASAATGGTAYGGEGSFNFSGNGTHTREITWPSGSPGFDQEVLYYRISHATGNNSPIGTAGAIQFTKTSPPPKEVYVLFINNDDRDWFATFDGEEGPRAVTVPYGGNNSMTLEEGELPDAAKYGTLAATRTMRELHNGDWYYQSGTFYDSNAEAGLTHTYQWKVSWGPLSKADAKDPANQFTVTIGAGAAKQADPSKFTAANDAWVIPEPTEETPEPVAPTVQPTKGPSPVAEINKKTHEYLIKTIDPETGQSQLQGYFGPVTGTVTPTTNDGAAIVEALGEIQGRSEKMHQLGILQGEDGAQVAKGQLGALDLADKAGQGMGGEGESAGTAAAALIGEAPGGLPYSIGGGTMPTLSVSMPATFGGGTFNFNPFTSDRLGPIASWFRTATHWLCLVLLGVWIWSAMGDWIRGISTLPQAKGNAVIGGTGGQATALVAAGLMTAAIVVAITGLLAWSFGDLAFGTIMSAALSNPVTALPGGILWMIDQLFPVGTIVLCLVARIAFNFFAAGLFATCAAVVRFIVP